MNPPTRGTALHTARLMPEFQAEPLYADRVATAPAPPYDDGLPVAEIADDHVYADLDGISPEQALIDYEDTMIAMYEGELS